MLLLLINFIAQAASFDCNKASSATEKMICADPILNRLDEQMGQKYKNALQTDGDSVRASQRAWLSEVRNCNNEFCIRRLYEERIAKLDSAPKSTASNSAPPPTPNKPSTRADTSVNSLARCSAVLGLAALEMARQGESKVMKSFQEASANLKAMANKQMPYSEKAIDAVYNEENFMLLEKKKQWKPQDYMDELTSKVGICQKTYIQAAEDMQRR